MEKMLHEKLLGSLKNSANTLLDAFPEPAAIVFAVVWKEPFEGLPVGTICARDGEITVGVLADCVSQSAKMAKFAASQIESIVNQTRAQSGKGEKGEATPGSVAHRPAPDTPG